MGRSRLPEMLFRAIAFLGMVTFSVMAQDNSVSTATPTDTQTSKGSIVIPQITGQTSQKTEAIDTSPSVTTASIKNIPTQSAAPSVTPSYSTSISASSVSREVTYQTSERPSPQTTVETRATIPLSSIPTPALVLTVSPDEETTTQKQPLVVTTASEKTDKAVTTSDSNVLDTISPSFSVYSETPVISSSQLLQTSTYISSSIVQPSVSIVPSSTVDIVTSPTPDISVVETTTRITTELTTETTTESLTTEVKRETTTETSTVSTTAETTTESLDITTASESTPRTTVHTSRSSTQEQTTESRYPDQDSDEATTSEIDTMSISTTTETTMKVPITIPLTYEPPLNTSDVYNEYWIVTVLRIPRDEDTTTREFVHGMETKLAQLFGESLGGRKGRAATFNNATTVQMIMVNRSDAEPQHTSLTYYVMHHGVPVPAHEAIRIINGISSQRLAILLGYEVISVGEVYKKGPDRKLWIIGAVVGALVVLVSLIWCVLFIYFKCTRPAGKRSPRTARSNRTIDPESSFRAKKDFRVSQRDLRGFDIVRTEVGLESEIQREKGRSSDSYRRMAGSSELEGMYSPGDTPPPDAPLVQPSQEAMASRPNSKVHSLSRPLPSLPGSIGRKGKGKKTREESSEGETTGSEKPLTPANKNQGRKKGRAWSKGHSEDSDEDSDDEDGGPTRSSLHGVRLPPIPNPPYPSESYRDSLRQQQELEDSLKSKAESERQRNKQRQRDKKKEKKSKKDLKKEAEAKKAYKMVQKEMGQMLEEHKPSSHQPNVFIDDQKNKGKKKRQLQQPNMRDSFELSELSAVHQQVEQDLRGLSSLRGDSDEESRQKAFEEARQRMHALLDDAFALIAPNPSIAQLTEE